MTLSSVRPSPEGERLIANLVGSLTDSIICWPGYEYDKPLDFMREAINIARLLDNMAANKEGRDPLGTDPECAWYLSTASLAQVPTEQWTRIYMYCFNQTMKLLNRDIPTDLRQDTLNDYDMGYLKSLKIWIYETRVKHRKEKERAARGEARKIEIEEVKAEKAPILQPSMF